MTQAFNLSQFANKVNTSGQADLTTAVTGTLPKGNGGTGQTTYTNGQLLIGNTSTGGLDKATLTAGSGVSITNGAGAITIASTASGGFSNMQVFNSPGTFTTPASTTQIKVTVVGGGANSAATPSTYAYGAGGAGGAAIYVGPVSASTPYSVTVGTAGNTSSFGVLASATGGSSNAPGSPFASPIGLGGSGGTGTAGTLLIRGGAGTPGIVVKGTAPNIWTGGGGGNSIFGGGGGGAGIDGSVPAQNGTLGGGAGGSLSGSYTGGTGVVIVEY